MYVQTQPIAPRRSWRARTEVARQERVLSPSVVALVLLICSWFYCLPLGRFAVGGVASDFRIYDFISVIVLVLLGPAQVFRIRAIARDRSRFYFWAIMLLLLCALSLLVPVVSGETSKLPTAAIRLYRFATYLMVPVLIASIAHTPARQLLLMRVLFANIVVQAALAFLQGIHILPGFWPEYWVTGYWSAGMIPVGTLSPHHKHISVVMMLGMGMAATFLRTTRSPFLRIGYAVLIVTMFVVIIFSGSRTSWLGAVVAVLAYLGAHRGRAIPLLAFAMLVGLALVTYSPETVRDRMDSSISTRFTDRIERFGLEGIAGERTVIYVEDIPHAILSRPLVLLTGTGFNHAPSVLSQSTAAHNNYLHVLLELGVIGLAVYLKMLFRVLSTLRRSRLAARTELQKVYATDAWAMFVAIMITLLVGETLWAQYSMFTLSGQIMAYMAVAALPLQWKLNERAREKALPSVAPPDGRTSTARIGPQAGSAAPRVRGKAGVLPRLRTTESGGQTPAHG